MTNMVIDGTNGITFPDTSIQAKSAQGPCFRAYQSTLQSVTLNTPTKIQLQTKVFDTTSAFDNTTNYRFTPQVSGYYQVNGGCFFGNASARTIASIYKNGAEDTRGYQLNVTGAVDGCSVSTLVFLNGTTDYIELYAQTSVTQNTTAGAVYTCLSAVLVRAA